MVDQTERRVVITGLGVVAANGIGKGAFWQATSKGISGIKPIQRIPTDSIEISVAGEVSDFLATDYIYRKLIKRTDRMTHFVFAAVQEAVLDARLTLAEEDSHRLGVVIANTMGGMGCALEQISELHRRGPRYLSAFTALAWLPVANAGQLSIRHAFQGYSKTPVNDTVGGLDALGIAYRAIRRGAADILIAGGCEAFLEPFVLLTLVYKGHLLASDDPRAYRPFDRRAAGLLPGEGAGICILEDYEHAQRRDAPIYGEIVGYGQTNDAHGLLAPSFDGKQYARAIQLAMQEGGLRAKDIGYFSLDGHALPASDQGEAEGLHFVFGTDLDYLPVSVPRTMLGHSYAASGALDTLTACLALQYGLVPPTINCEELDPRYGLDLVRDEARPLSQPAVLLGGRSFGGANVVLAIRRL